MEPGDRNGWSEYSRLVLAELKRLDGELRQVNISLKEIQVELAMLKVKAGVWGSIGALIPIIVFIVMRQING